MVKSVTKIARIPELCKPSVGRPFPVFELLPETVHHILRRMPTATNRTARTLDSVNLVSVPSILDP